MTIRLLNSRIWVALAVVVSLALSSSIVTAAAPSRSAKLSMHDLQLLANARAENKSVVTLLIAAKPGANNTVAAGACSLWVEPFATAKTPSTTCASSFQ